MPSGSNYISDSVLSLNLSFFKNTQGILKGTNSSQKNWQLRFHHFSKSRQIDY